MEIPNLTSANRSPKMQPDSQYCGGADPCAAKPTTIGASAVPAALQGWCCRSRLQAPHFGWVPDGRLPVLVTIQHGNRWGSNDNAPCDRLDFVPKDNTCQPVQPSPVVATAATGAMGGLVGTKHRLSTFRIDTFFSTTHHYRKTHCCGVCQPHRSRLQHNQADNLGW
ncbi:hypothetical protein CCHOA_06545 [Corynebacterium choanae]|uniref:Uncharacterized protein n=1 Tax=Corynebacterium choanae TaxID=1862358 RepID=A0A3G6J9Z0_9CORY|nr:hypothetical protein CCHOA_06545 [Corynebacterium choanae]